MNRKGICDVCEEEW
ncbi:hypothetical protein JTS93_05405 [Clostridium botulinum]|nr:hypothetical protein [Clostridium botulinum]